MYPYILCPLKKNKLKRCYLARLIWLRIEKLKNAYRNFLKKLEYVYFIATEFGFYKMKRQVRLVVSSRVTKFDLHKL